MEHLEPNFIKMGRDDLRDIVEKALAPCAVINDVKHLAHMGDDTRIKGYIGEVAVQRLYGCKESEFSYGRVGGQDFGEDVRVRGEAVNIKVTSRTVYLHKMSAAYVFNLREGDVLRGDHPDTLIYVFVHMCVRMLPRNQSGVSASPFPLKGNEGDKRIRARIVELREMLARDGIPPVIGSLVRIQEAIKSDAYRGIVSDFQGIFKELVVLGFVPRQEVIAGQRGILIPGGTPRENGSRVGDGFVVEVPIAELYPAWQAA